MLRLQQVMTKDVSLRSFLVAGTITVVAVAAREVLDVPLPGTSPFITLYPAVAIAGLLCGFWAGAASAILSAFAAFFLWMQPRLSFAAPSMTDGVTIGLFALSSLAVLWIAAELRAQLAAATLAREAFDLGLAAGGVGTWEMDLRSKRINASAGAFDLHGLRATQGGTTAEDWLRGIPPEVWRSRAARPPPIPIGCWAARLGRDGSRRAAARCRPVAGDACSARWWT
jgi:hypothetical protein